MLLWTDEFMKNHYEGGHWINRKGNKIWQPIFIGAMEPTHWFPLPDLVLPPFPE